VHDFLVTALPARARDEAADQAASRRRASGNRYQPIHSAGGHFVVTSLNEGDYEVRAVTAHGVTGSTFTHVKAGERQSGWRIVIGTGVTTRGE